MNSDNENKSSDKVNNWWNQEVTLKPGGKLYVSIFLSYYHQNASRFPKTMDNYHKGHLSKKFNLFSLTTPPMCYIFVGLASAPIRTLCPVDILIIKSSFFVILRVPIHFIHIYMPYSKIIFFKGRACFEELVG